MGRLEETGRPLSQIGKEVPGKSQNVEQTQIHAQTQHNLIVSSVYCSIIHGGLQMTFTSSQLLIQNCCLRKDHTSNFVDIWKNPSLESLRTTNIKGVWDPGCGDCEKLEKAGHVSMRTGLNDGLKIYPRTDLTGPAKIDLVFDTSCNLACRTCGTHSSTYWQRYLKQHDLWSGTIASSRSKDDAIEALSRMDLSNLRMLVFCGGETMLGQEYWDVAAWLADNVPNAKQQLTLCFQTNGTQTIHPRNFKTIEKVFLVKLNISLDGVKERFEYLRWPANWNQVTDNILNLKEIVPSNTMFLIEETVSIFNLAYLGELDDWVVKNFSTNREGDLVNHTKHLALGMFGLHNCSQKYVDWIQQTNNQNLISPDWKENPVQISNMIDSIHQHDQFRSQSFAKTFPEVAGFYDIKLDNLH